MFLKYLHDINEETAVYYTVSHCVCYTIVVTLDTLTGFERHLDELVWKMIYCPKPMYQTLYKFVQNLYKTMY